MARYDRGYDGRAGYRGPEPYGGYGRSGPRSAHGYRGYRGDGSWAEPYRRGYPGEFTDTPGYGRRPRSYDRDYWWLGEHELNRQGVFDRYDRAFAEFDRHSHPRFSPVGGTYAAMGGRYAYHRPPRPLREDTWFSDWTRWF